jgi:hypothetical protein
MINEELARRTKENMSFSDYKPGSATAEYNAVIADAAEKIEKAKLRVSPEGQERLDSILERYKVTYANWINKSNANGAGHVSVMISGPSNYNMRTHEKYMNRVRTLWAEYGEINDIDHKIWSIVNGDKIIKSDDANAIEKLQTKIDKLQASQDLMKAANKIIKKKKLTDEEKIAELVKLGISEEAAKGLLQGDFCGRVGFASYSLTNNNATIRNAKQRIEHLQRLAEKAATTPVEDLTTEINGIRIVDNLEAQRLQVIFPGKPEANIREQLKKNGFRWSPANGAWQSYRSDRAERTAKEIVESLS